MAILDKVFRWLGHGRYSSTLPTALNNGDVGELLIDAYGRPRVLVESSAPPSATAVRQLTAASTGILKAAGTGTLYEVTVWNSGASALWFQVHDKASAVSPGDACVDQILVPAGASVGWRPAIGPSASTQLRWAASTTASTYTAPGADSVGFTAAVT